MKYNIVFTISIVVHCNQVESLTAARTTSVSGNEPSDAIRVVNALLTQLDQIKRYPNVLILTTSNITGAIDLAFVDRYILSTVV
jgi:SpoVK/Ycf46/Vps4 family AAA+-type ATPase